jgi:phenylpyruvate tautomerase PptA (4-oxalocrotonate tautomerase family)
MPYLRLYARDLPMQQKRVIAQGLIDITLRTFKLRASQRYQTSVQFITISPGSEVGDEQAEIPRGADFTLEVIGHNLTEEKKRAFAEEVAALLTPMAPIRLGPRIVRLLGIRANTHRQIALQFNELSPAVSDPFVADSQPHAA